MNRERFARNLRHAAADADWQRAERLGRAYGWSLLGGALRKAIVAATAWFRATRRATTVNLDTTRRGDRP